MHGQWVAGSGGGVANFNECTTLEGGGLCG